MYSYGKIPFRVSKLKFSVDNLQNSRCNIRSLSLLRKDANLSRLVVRNLYESMKRACVFDYALQEKLKPKMIKLKPLPSIYYPDFIAANQEDRANNLIPKGTKQQDLEHIRNDIRAFKKHNNLERVIILWTANTERYVDGNNSNSFFPRNFLLFLF